MSNTDDDIVSPPFCIDQRSSAVETHVFSPFSLWLTLRSGHADHSPFHLLPLGFRTAFRPEPEISVLELLEASELPLMDWVPKRHGWALGGI